MNYSSLINLHEGYKNDHTAQDGLKRYFMISLNNEL